MIKPHLIKKPVVSEKSVALASEQNTYTFLVERLANKNQIKQAIENLYQVGVESVNTVFSNRRLKKTGKRRLPTTIAKEKKALVKLKKGEKIDLFDTYK